MVKLEDEIKEFKKTQTNLTQNYQARSQLIAQQQENALVKTEFENMEQDAVVYKLVGQILVKQHVEDAKVNVEKRIEYITDELKRVDGVVADLEKNANEKRQLITQLQQAQGQAVPAN